MCSCHQFLRNSYSVPGPGPGAGNPGMTTEPMHMPMYLEGQRWLLHCPSLLGYSITMSFWNVPCGVKRDLINIFNCISVSTPESEGHFILFTAICILLLSSAHTFWMPAVCQALFRLREYSSEKREKIRRSLPSWGLCASWGRQIKLRTRAGVRGNKCRTR